MNRSQELKRAERLLITYLGSEKIAGVGDRHMPKDVLWTDNIRKEVYEVCGGSSMFWNAFKRLKQKGIVEWWRIGPYWGIRLSPGVCKRFEQQPLPAETQADETV